MKEDDSEPPSRGRRLHGRDPELARVRDLLTGLDTGTGGVLLVEGGAGTGKSALLDHVAAAAAERGCQLVRAAADEFDPAAPGAALRSLVIPRPGGSAVRDRGDGLRAVLAERAGRDPVVAVMDDLQLADLDSLALLRTLAVPECAGPVAWVLARDSGVAGPAGRMFGLLGGAGAGRVELTALTREAAAELVTERLGATPDAALSRFIAEADGNPLLLTELVEGLRGGGDIALVGGRAVLVAARIPQRVRRRVEQWLGRLSAPARQLVLAGAVLGRRFAAADLAKMLGGTTAGMLPAVEEAIGTGILLGAGDALAFRQSLVWRAALDSVPAPVRLALEAEAAGAAGAEPARVPASPARRGERAGPAPASRPSPRMAAEVRCALAFTHVKLGRPVQAADEAAVVLAEPDLPDALYQQATAARLCALFGQDATQASHFAERVLRSGRADGGSATVAALVVLSCAAWRRGRVVEAMDYGRQGVASPAAAAPDSWRIDARMALAVKLSALGDFAESAAQLTDAQQETDLLDDLAVAAALAMVRGWTQVQSGQLAQAAESARWGLAAAQRADSALFVPLGRSVLASVALRGCDLANAAEQVRRYRAELAQRDAAADTAQYAWVALQVAEAQHGIEAAIRMLDRDYPDLLDEPTLYLEEPSAAAWLTQAALHIGDRPRAAHVMSYMDKLVTENPGISVLAAAAEHARGVLGHDPGPLERAASQHVHPRARARAVEDLGALFADRGGAADRRAAATTLNTALDEYAQLGAVQDAARTHARLRRLGVRRARRQAPRPEAQSGWSSLTDIERTIAGLVAHGMTNRQAADQLYLSPHTVNFHLRRIFRKLDIGSRTQLARIHGGRAEPGPSAPGR